MCHAVAQGGYPILIGNLLNGPRSWATPAAHALPKVLPVDTESRATPPVFGVVAGSGSFLLEVCTCLHQSAKMCTRTGRVNGILVELIVH